MRVAVLWIELTGYLNSCLRELASRPGIDLFVAHTPPCIDNPFDREQFAWIAQQLVWRGPADLEPLDARLDDFQPEILVLSGWTVPAYRKVARRWRSRTVRIMAMDNCWFGTVKQWIGVLSAPFFVHRLADAIWVPGERQSQFASKLQFRQSAILHGLYSGDSSAFAATYEARVHQKQPVKRVFVFVGRMVEVKGIPTLIAAYRLYRSRTQNPWPLVCYGQGPLASMLRAEQGIVVEGFVQPEDLPVKLANAACLVLPSSFEPWAVVINEATAAGMLVLASGVVGAVPHLVQNNYNGFIFDVGDADGLAWLMNRVSRMDDQKLNLMAAASSLLAKQFTPARWADTLLNFMETNAENCRPIARIAG